VTGDPAADHTPQHRIQRQERASANHDAAQRAAQDFRPQRLRVFDRLLRPTRQVRRTPAEQGQGRNGAQPGEDEADQAQEPAERKEAA
jgi:hypothetical protein